MPFSLQSQLAHALTSAGSQRRLAAQLGISHQKLGRWLREGEPGGAKQIPREAAPAINTVFKIHKELTRQQARVDGIPYDPKAPVFMQRPKLATGEQGDRVIGLNTEFIRQADRTNFLKSVAASREYLNISVRSYIDWFVYMQDKEIERARRGDRAPRAMELLSNRNIRVSRRNSAGGISSIITRADHRPVYTKRQWLQAAFKDRNGNYVMRDLGAADAINATERLLYERHSPAAIRLADEYLLQIKPTGFDDDFKTQKLQPARKKAKPKPAQSSRAKKKSDPLKRR